MKYSNSHEWITINNNIGVVGISRYAQKEIGEIVHIKFPKIGKIVQANEEVGVLESTKSAIDIYSPISGKIIAINEKLQKDLSLINESPETLGWIFKIEASNLKELEELE